MPLDCTVFHSVSQTPLKRDKKTAHVYIPVRSCLSADRLKPHLFLFFNSIVIKIALEKCDALCHDGMPGHELYELGWPRGIGRMRHTTPHERAPTKDEI